MNKVIRILNLHYYGSVGVLAVLFILVLSKVISLIGISSVGLIAERYSLGLTLIAIPIALKLFANILNKFSDYNNEDEAIKTYKKATFMRLYIINVMTLSNIILYAMSHNMNFVWMAVVLFIVYVFCKPSYHELESLTVNKEELEKENIDNE